MFGKQLLGTIALALLILQSTSYALDVNNTENIEVQNELLVQGRTRPGSMARKVIAYDPINHQMYDRVVVGETFKNKKPFRRYDYWRYITVYNVYTTEERIAYLPFFEEDCHDNSFFMAEWGESRSIKVTLSSEVKAERLGLSASVGMSIEQGTTFSTNRRIKAEKGVKAKHFPIKVSDEYEGVTYIQTYNKKTKSYGYLAPSYYDRWTDNYPYEFYLNNQNIGLRVKREVIKLCEGYDPNAKDSIPGILQREEAASVITN